MSGAAKEIFGSNLFLSGREARFSAPSKGENKQACFASQNERENEWAALSAAHEKVGKIPESQIIVPARGIEPLTIAL